MLDRLIIRDMVPALVKCILNCMEELRRCKVIFLQPLSDAMIEKCTFRGKLISPLREI